MKPTLPFQMFLSYRECPPRDFRSESEKKIAHYKYQIRRNVEWRKEYKRGTSAYAIYCAKIRDWGMKLLSERRAK
jgi:hypothetical protein